MDNKIGQNYSVSVKVGRNISDLVRGYVVPILGWIGGYAATRNVGAASATMAFTSFCSGMLDSHYAERNSDSNNHSIRDYGYISTFSLGSMVSLIALVRLIVQNGPRQ